MEKYSDPWVRGNGLEQARRECMDREGWRSFCRGHPPRGGHSQKEQGVGGGGKEVTLRKET